LPTPKPTTPWPSPTTTSALKLRFLPPLTDLGHAVDRDHGVLDLELRRVHLLAIAIHECIARTPDLLRGSFRHRLDATVIEEAVAIEHDALHALFEQPLRDRLANRLGALDVAALRRLRQRTLTVGSTVDARRWCGPVMSSTTCT
jgi:hypothetical protein